MTVAVGAAGAAVTAAPQGPAGPAGPAVDPGAEAALAHPVVDRGWSLGAMPSSYVLTDVRLVLPGRVTERAAVVVADGVIIDIVEGLEAATLRGDVDGGGMLLVPGLVDVHSDALEKERMPRPSAPLPLDFALRSFDAKVAAAGVTTVFHGAGFHRKMSDGVQRHPATALELCEAVDTFASDRVDHRVLHRFDVRGEEGAALIRERMARRPAHAEPILLSHEDHTPGQGQYADVDRFIETLIAGGEDRAVATAKVAAYIAEGERVAPIREANLRWAGEQAKSGLARLVGHDPDTAQAVDALAARGGVVAEFPTTLEAARRARELGLVIVAGGPNVLRGSSHSGNISAGELVQHGLVDALASDYLPSSLLAAALQLATQGALGLPEAIRLVSAGPALAAGLEDRGRIEVGLRADFTLVDDRERLPRVLTTLSAGPASAQVSAC